MSVLWAFFRGYFCVFIKFLWIWLFVGEGIVLSFNALKWAYIVFGGVGFWWFDG